MSLCFLNTLEGTALEFFRIDLTMDTPFDQIVKVMTKQFNSEHRQQQILSETIGLTLESVMKERKLTYLSDGLDDLVARINRNVPQLPDGFNTEKHKVYSLREAVISYG